MRDLGGFPSIKYARRIVKKIPPIRGGISGPEGTRTPDLLSAIEAKGSSTMSIAYIWWYKFFIVTRYGGHFVHNVH